MTRRAGFLMLSLTTILLAAVGYILSHQPMRAIEVRELTKKEKWSCEPRVEGSTLRCPLPEGVFVRSEQ